MSNIGLAVCSVLPYLAGKVIFRGMYKEISAGHNRGESRMTQGGGDISVIFYVHDIFEHIRGILVSMHSSIFC